MRLYFLLFNFFMIFLIAGCGPKAGSETSEQGSQTTSNGEHGHNGSEQGSQTSSNGEHGQNSSEQGSQTTSNGEHGQNSIEARLFSAVKGNSLADVQNIISENSLLENDLGAKALNMAKDQAIKDALLEKTYRDFGGDDSGQIGRVLQKAIKENIDGIYKEFINGIIKRRRKEIGDNDLLNELAYVPQSFEFLSRAGLDLNTMVKPGVYNEGDKASTRRAPLLVLLPTIPWNLDQEGKVKILLAKSLIESGADVNAKDDSGHTALFYTLEKINKPYIEEWDKQQLEKFAQYLKEKGGISE